MSEPYDVSTEADKVAGIRRLCDRNGTVCVEPNPVGDPLWFDIRSLQLGLQSLLTMDKDTYEQWANGEHAAEFIDRIHRILQWVDRKQKPRIEALNGDFKP